MAVATDFHRISPPFVCRLKKTESGTAFYSFVTSIISPKAGKVKDVSIFLINWLAFLAFS